MNKKLLLVMGATAFIATGCSTVLEAMDSINTVSNVAAKPSSSTSKAIPHGMGEFQINKLTETEFQKIVAGKGLQIETCDNTICLLDEKGKTRVIKLTQSTDGKSRSPFEYKHGRDASTYALLNYQSSNSAYAFTRAYAYFFKGKLVVMYSNNHPDAALKEVERNYPSVKHTVQKGNPTCRINGEKTTRPQSLNYADWFIPADKVSMQWIRGQEVDTKTCEYKPYDFLKFYDRDQYIALEKYSLMNRLF